VLHEDIDVGHWFFDAAKGAVADSTLGDQSEPPFHLVQPRGIGGGVVQQRQEFETLVDDTARRIESGLLLPHSGQGVCWLIWRAEVFQSDSSDHL
jgi:hypothetical protein